MAEEVGNFSLYILEYFLPNDEKNQSLLDRPEHSMNE
jgi:hypothetical protein